MRNRIFLIVLILFIIILTIAMINGIKIGNFQVPSIKQLTNKNQEINEKIEKASTLTSIDYPNNVEKLEDTYEKFTLKKQKYEEMSDFTDEDGNNIYEIKQYDIVYLWELFGKYAKSNNLKIEMSVKSNGSKEDFYDLYFTTTGKYTDISQFINNIENNSDLYFRIYNFKMSGNGETVTSTFTVKNVKLDSSTLQKESTSTTNTNNINNNSGNNSITATNTTSGNNTAK
jgi:hypothetical protein